MPVVLYEQFPSILSHLSPSSRCCQKPTQHEEEKWKQKSYRGTKKRENSGTENKKTDKQHRQPNRARGRQRKFKHFLASEVFHFPACSFTTFHWLSENSFLRTHFSFMPTSLSRSWENSWSEVEVDFCLEHSQHSVPAEQNVCHPRVDVETKDNSLSWHFEINITDKSQNCRLRESTRSANWKFSLLATKKNVVFRLSLYFSLFRLQVWFWFDFDVWKNDVELEGVGREDEHAYWAELSALCLMMSFSCRGSVCVRVFPWQKFTDFSQFHISCNLRCDVDVSEEVVGVELFGSSAQSIQWAGAWEEV